VFRIQRSRFEFDTPNIEPGTANRAPNLKMNTNRCLGAMRYGELAEALAKAGEART
jgi:hypothetical protein